MATALLALILHSATCPFCSGFHYPKDRCGMDDGLHPFRIRMAFLHRLLFCLGFPFSIRVEIPPCLIVFACAAGFNVLLLLKVGMGRCCRWTTSCLFALMLLHTLDD